MFQNKRNLHKSNTKNYRNISKSIYTKILRVLLKMTPISLNIHRATFWLENPFFNILPSILFISSVFRAFNSLMMVGAVLNTLFLRRPYRWKSKGDKSELCGCHKPMEINRSAKMMTHSLLLRLAIHLSQNTRKWV